MVTERSALRLEESKWHPHLQEGHKGGQRELQDSQSHLNPKGRS